MKNNRFFVAIVSVAMPAVLMTSPVSANTTLTAYGGQGSAAFDDRCPSHQFLIGLAGRVGAWIDQIQIICAPILSDGTQGSKYYGPSRGGDGGGRTERSCPADSIVNAAHIYLNEVAHPRVSRVEISCDSVKAHRHSFTVFDGNVATELNGNSAAQQCPAQDLASGFNGRYGSDVNALGLDCKPRAIVNASTATMTGTAALAAPVAAACPQGYVWRAASSADLVCVTPEQRTIAAGQNATAASRVSPTDRTYGPNTCVRGYVWREAFTGDTVCVTPLERTAARSENANAPSHR